TSSTGPSDEFTYLAAPAPSVSGVSPGSGPTTVSTPVTITGTNFNGTTDVFFGDTPAVAFRILSDTEISALAPPPAAPGPVDVKVTTFSGTSATSSADRFTYTEAPRPAVTSISPATGSSAGGTPVTITGTDFTGVTGVFFGGIPAQTFAVNSPTSITAF